MNGMISALYVCAGGAERAAGMIVTEHNGVCACEDNVLQKVFQIERSFIYIAALKIPALNQFSGIIHIQHVELFNGNAHIQRFQIFARGGKSVQLRMIAELLAHSEASEIGKQIQ